MFSLTGSVILKTRLFSLTGLSLYIAVGKGGVGLDDNDDDNATTTTTAAINAAHEARLLTKEASRRFSSVIEAGSKTDNKNNSSHTYGKNDTYYNRAREPRGVVK